MNNSQSNGGSKNKIESEEYQLPQFQVHHIDDDFIDNEDNNMKSLNNISKSQQQSVLSIKSESEGNKCDGEDTGQQIKDSKNVHIKYENNQLNINQLQIQQENQKENEEKESVIGSYCEQQQYDAGQIIGNSQFDQASQESQANLGNQIQNLKKDQNNNSIKCIEGSNKNRKHVEEEGKERNLENEKQKGNQEFQTRANSQELTIQSTNLLKSQLKRQDSLSNNPPCSHNALRDESDNQNHHQSANNQTLKSSQFKPSTYELNEDSIPNHSQIQLSKTHNYSGVEEESKQQHNSVEFLSQESPQKKQQKLNKSSIGISSTLGNDANYLEFLNLQKKQSGFMPNVGFQSLSPSEQHEWLAQYLIQYSPDKKPFDLDQAMNHQTASRVYKEKSNYDLSYFVNLRENNCPCCNLPISQNLLDNHCEKKESETDKENQCRVSFVQTFATSNRSKSTPSITDFVFNFITTAILMLYTLFLFRKKMKIYEKIADTEDVSVSDYSLMISHIPLDQTKEQITNFFESLKNRVNFNIELKQIEKEFKKEQRERPKDNLQEKAKDKFDRFISVVKEDPEFKKDIFEGLEEGQKLENSIQVEKVVLSYEIENYMMWKNRHEEIEIAILEQEQELQYLDQLKQGEKNQENMQQIQLLESSMVIIPTSVKNERDELLQKIKKYEFECLNTQGSKKSNRREISHQTGVAFISFKTERMAILVKEYFTYSLVHRYFSFLFPPTEKLYNENKLTVRYAPEPGAIQWENLGKKTINKIYRRIFTFLFTVIILGICFAFILMISLEQRELSKKEKNIVKNFLISASSSILIMIINSLLSFSIDSFANFEIYSTTTDFYCSIAKKLGIAQFINTALITFSVNLSIHGTDLFVMGGLVQDIMTLMLLDTIVPPLMNFIDISWIIGKYLPQKYYIKFENKRYQLSQKNANELFEDRKFDPAQRFANIIKTLLFASFYAYLIPLGSLLSEWYLMLRRQSMPIPIGAELIHEMLDFYIELLIVAYSSGCFIFELLLYKTAYISTTVQLGLSIVYWFFPMDQIVTKLFNLQQEANKNEEEDDYQISKQKFKFATDYDRSNPVTQRYALQEYMEFEIDCINKAKEAQSVKKNKSNLSLKEQQMIENQDISHQDLVQKLQLFKTLRENNSDLKYIKESYKNKWNKQTMRRRVFDYVDVVTRLKIQGLKQKNLKQITKKVQNLNKLQLNKIAPIKEQEEDNDTAK